MAEQKQQVTFICMDGRCCHEWTQWMTDAECQEMQKGYEGIGKTPECPMCGATRPVFGATGKLDSAAIREIFNMRGGHE